MTMDETTANNHVRSSGSFRRTSLQLLNRLEGWSFQGIQRSKPPRFEFLSGLWTKIYAALFQWNRLVGNMLSGFSVQDSNKEGDY